MCVCSWFTEFLFLGGTHSSSSNIRTNSVNLFLMGSWLEKERKKEIHTFSIDLEFIKISTCFWQLKFLDDLPQCPSQTPPGRCPTGKSSISWWNSWLRAFCNHIRKSFLGIFEIWRKKDSCQIHRCTCNCCQLRYWYDGHKVYETLSQLSHLQQLCVGHVVRGWNPELFTADSNLTTSNHRKAKTKFM